MERLEGWMSGGEIGWHVNATKTNLVIIISQEFQKAAQLIISMELWTKTFDNRFSSVSLKEKKSIHISLSPFDSFLLKKVPECDVKQRLLS